MANVNTTIPDINSLHHRLFEIELELYQHFTTLFGLDAKGKKQSKTYKNELEKLKKTLQKEKKFVEIELEDVVTLFSLYENAKAKKTATPDTKHKKTVTQLIITRITSLLGNRLATIISSADFREYKIKCEIIANMNLLGARYLYGLINDGAPQTPPELAKIFSQVFSKEKLDHLEEVYDSCFAEPNGEWLLAQQLPEISDERFYSCFSDPIVQFETPHAHIQNTVDEICTKNLKTILQECIQAHFTGNMDFTIIANVQAARTIMSPEAFKSFNTEFVIFMETYGLKPTSLTPPNARLYYDFITYLLSDATKPKGLAMLNKLKSTPQ